MLTVTKLAPLLIMDIRVALKFVTKKKVENYSVFLPPKKLVTIANTIICHFSIANSMTLYIHIYVQSL